MPLVLKTEFYEDWLQPLNIEDRLFIHLNTGLRAFVDIGLAIHLVSVIGGTSQSFAICSIVTPSSRFERPGRRRRGTQGVRPGPSDVLPAHPIGQAISGATYPCSS